MNERLVHVRDSLLSDLPPLTDRARGSTPREPQSHHTRSVGAHVCQTYVTSLAYAGTRIGRRSTRSASAMLTSAAWSPQPGPKSGRTVGRVSPGIVVRVDLEPARVAGALAAGGVEPGERDPRRRDRAAGARPVSPRSTDGNSGVTGSVPADAGPRRVDADDVRPGDARAPEHRAGRRPAVEARVGDHAARRGRARRTAGRGGSRRRRALVRGVHLAAEQDRRHEQAPLRAASGRSRS